MLTAALISLLVAFQPTPAAPASGTPKASGRYTLIKLAGDLDSEHLVVAFGKELDDSKDAGLIIVEMDANRARTDIVASLGARIKASRAPVAILLKDAADKKVGIGPLLLGAYAKNCYIDPDTVIVDDPTCRIGHLAPPDIQWEPIEREISGVLWTRLGERNADQALAQVLVTPRRDYWAVPVESGNAWRLAEAQPAGGQEGPQPRQILFAAANGPSNIHINADTAVGLRLCAAKTPSIAPILADAHLAARATRTSRTVTSGLPDALSTANRILDDTRLSLRRIGTTLAVKGTAGRPASRDDYRLAGNTAMNQIDHAYKEIEKVESLLADYPELERRLGLPAKKGPGPVRASIDAIHKDLEKVKVIARDFQSR